MVPIIGKKKAMTKKDEVARMRQFSFEVPSANININEQMRRSPTSFSQRNKAEPVLLQSPQLLQFGLGQLRPCLGILGPGFEAPQPQLLFLTQPKRPIAEGCQGSLLAFAQATAAGDACHGQDARGDVLGRFAGECNGRHGVSGRGWCGLTKLCRGGSRTNWR